MLEKKLDGDRTVVTFVLAESDHRSPVAVAGEFNGWDPARHLLVGDGDGWITCSVEVPTGARVEFRYRDGEGRWFNDDGADDYVENEWGGANGVVVT